MDNDQGEDEERALGSHHLLRGEHKDKEGADQCQNREGDMEVRGSQGSGKPDLTSGLMGGLIKAV